MKALPRFDLETLRPFEAVMVDNKQFPCRVRGDYKDSLIFICVKSRAKMKINLHSKTQNGDAFGRMVCQFGIHKLDYKCTVYTDGCGSMEHVRVKAMRMGLHHQYIPPR